MLKVVERNYLLNNKIPASQMDEIYGFISLMPYILSAYIYIVLLVVAEMVKSQYPTIKRRYHPEELLSVEEVGKVVKQKIANLRQKHNTTI